MSLNPEIAKAILDAKASIYGHNFFLQRDFENPTAYVRTVQPERPNVEEGCRSTIEVVVSMFVENTLVEDVQAFCASTKGLTVLSVEDEGLISMKVTIVLE